MTATNADYIILEDSEREVLQQRVIELLHKNYLPLGGVTVVALGDDQYLYVQTMTFNVFND